jgi:hypothetical protein
LFLNEWNLREALLAVTHRWVVILIFLLIGGLLGLGGSFIAPSPYRATLDLYVGIDAYRANQDSYWSSVAKPEYRNLDDYKNWQMSQLSALIMGGEIINDTLNRLRESDPEWESVQLGVFRQSLQASFRNTGIWHLTAEDADPIRAARAVEVWADVILEKINTALGHAEQVMFLDSQLQAVNQKHAETSSRLILISNLHTKITDWHDDLIHRPGNQLLDPLERWELGDLVSRAAGWEVAWQKLLDEIPAEDVEPVYYLLWVDRALLLIDEELQVLPDQIAGLEVQRTDLERQYVLETGASKALSANLSVQMAFDEPPKVERVRPTGIAVLIGLALGLLVWGFGALVVIAWKTI